MVMTPANRKSILARLQLASWTGVALLVLTSACGMRSALLVEGIDGSAEDPGLTNPGGGAGHISGTGGAGALGAGGHLGLGGAISVDAKPATGQGGFATDARPGTGGAAGTTTGSRGGTTGTTTPGGGSPGSSNGGNHGTGGGTGTGAKGGSGGAAGGRDASPDAIATDAGAPGAPTINVNSGYTTIATGTVVMSGYVSSFIGGSGSTIGLTYTATSFCASGTVGASTTYNSWAGAGFNVNQSQSGSSGSTNQLTLVGSSVTVSYVNKGGSPLELQLWDGSDYWCYNLPPSTTPNTVTVPFSKLNSQCWDGSGTAFTSGTPITTVQLDVPGAATTTTPFDYCFLGLTVQ